jgi:ferredoxin
MLYALSATEAGSAREIWWCHGARDSGEHPFAAEVRELLSGLAQSHSLVAYSKPEDGEKAGKDFDVQGHLNLELLEQRGVPKEADFYLCGPTTFLAEFTAALKVWGVADSCIHSEIFGAGPSITPGIASVTSPPPHPPGGAVGTGPNVFFTRSNLAVPWNSRYGSLLEFAEACNVPVRWACRAGVCHTCESGLIGGKIKYAPEPLDLPSEGSVLICCSTPLSEVELDL